jgi:DNA polymerase III delta prime subunit
VKDFLWVEKFRPRTIADCILPERIKGMFMEFVKKGEIPNLLLHGTAGVGKTTIAMAACDEAEIPHIIINASRDRGIETIRDTLTNYGSTMSLSGKRKVAILDEADNLTSDGQDALRGVMEEFSHNLTYILTCNKPLRLMEAIHSRTISVNFKMSVEEEDVMARFFAKRLLSILKKEEVQYEIPAVLAHVENYFPDFRRAINELQGLASRGAITEQAVASGKFDVEELYKALHDKDFRMMREWVGKHADLDANILFKQIYDDLYEMLEPSSIPPAVVLLANYQDKHTRSANPDINLAACLTELMEECNFK